MLLFYYKLYYLMMFRQIGGFILEDKKRSYSQAQNKATQKYIKANYDEIKLRLDKGMKAIIKEHADSRNESLNAFIKRSIDETIKHDKEQL